MALVIIAQMATAAVRGPDLGAAVAGAVAMGGLRAWSGASAAYRWVSNGVLEQALMWDAFVRPAKAPPSPTAGYRALADRMRRTDRHVREFAADQGMDRITIALSERPRAADHASSSRYRNSGHLWLGPQWFHPDHTAHLGPVVAHELAHLRRHDTARRVTVESVALGLSVGAAGLLSRTATLAFVATVWTVVIAWRWWSELACDAYAVRACGRAAVADMWTAYVAILHVGSPAARTWTALRNPPLRHPPLRVRRWFARHAPLPPVAGPLPVSPLALSADEPGDAPSNGSG